MGEILGLTISHYPNLRFGPANLPNSIVTNLGVGWQDKPHLKDKSKWPAEMRREWGSDIDQGVTEAKKVQAHQFEQFRKVKAALDDFKPDFMVIMYRDLGETFREPTNRPQFWFHTHDMVLSPYALGMRRDNVFEENPDKKVQVKNHPLGAETLIKGLREREFKFEVADKPPVGGFNIGLGHNGVAGIVHTDFDKREFKTPVVPMGVDPFGFGRTRNNEGMSKFDPKAPNPPLSPKQGFALGEAMAEILKASPWKVALLASTAWSHANNGGLEQDRIHQDIEADKKRFDEWKNNKFINWGSSFNWEEMEKHAQWELLISIILAGAMTKVGSRVKYADLTAGYIFNSSWVTTVFEPR